MAISTTIKQVGRLLRGRELQFKAVAITALCSYGGQLIGILLHWALWAIALATILPWIPLFAVKVFWTSKHYGFMATYLVLMILQAGHVGEHIAQMLQFVFIYDPIHGCFGWSWYGFCGDAHGIFGELDRELVHFVWDGLILVATIILRIHFRKSKNIWLTLAVIAAAVHQVEHIYLYGNYLFNNYFYYHGGYFLGVQIINGLAAQNGILGHNGLLGSATGLDGPINAILPGRINLHFIYNTLVFIPMVLAFSKQVQVIYDEWLAKALPQLSEEQLIAATTQAENLKFAPGQIIFRQGDLADKLYIITKGQVDIWRAAKKDGPEKQVGRLGEGQYFGEIELLGRTERAVTARSVTTVECLTLNRDVFKSLLIASGQAYKDVDVLLRRRLAHLGAMQGVVVQDSANTDLDTIMRTRIIRDRLKMLSGEDISRILGKAPIGAGNMLMNRAPVGAVTVATHSLPPRQAVGVPTAPTHPLPPRQAVGVPTVPTHQLPPRQTVNVAEQGVAGMAPAPIGFHRGVLVVRRGPSAGLRFEINAPRIIVGRRSVATNVGVPLMQIDDARVSRQHLEIFAQPDGLYVRDMGSANGTRLNGEKLGRDAVRVQDGAELMLGPDSMLSYRLN